MTRLLAIARKEAIQLRRDRRSLAMAFLVPALLTLLFGYVINFDVRDISLAVLDQDRTAASRRLVEAFTASGYFTLAASIDRPAEAGPLLERRRAKLVLVIPPGFARDLASGRPAEVQALLDGADANTASIALNYANAIAASAAGAPPSGPAGVEPRIRVWYNEELRSQNMVVPGLIAVIMMIIAAMLTALTIAREWERGTMEQLVSTPVRPAELILGKLIPYFVVGMADVVIAVAMAVFVFDVPLRGSVPLLFAMAALFIVGTLAQGIFISTVARGQLLASQLAMVSTFLPAFLLSGFMFAISNMPAPVQVITYIVPARYFVALVKGIYLRGVGLEVMWRDAVFLLVFAIVVTGLAIARFRKRIG